MSSFFQKNFIAIITCFILTACHPSKNINKVSAKAGIMDSTQITGSEKTKSDSFIYTLLANHPQFFNSIIPKKDELNVQIVYTQIDRKKNNKPKFTDHYFNFNPGKYFYPASTVKLPVAILALQKLNKLKTRGLDKNTTMITEADYSGQTAVYNDPNTPDGRPTIAHYIKKILLVSDNDAFNRLYEFLGQEYINKSLHKMGYTDAQILHRLQISLSEDENRHTNPVNFYDTNSNIIYKKPAQASRLAYAERNTKMGKGYYRGDQLINEPFDFSKKNRLSLEDLHHILRSIIFPKAIGTKQRFKLKKDDYNFLRKYISMTPSESKFPPYDSVNYWDNYVKFLFYGAEKEKPDSNIRIFNKPGDAYGFMIDVAYIVDYKNSIEFMLSAVIHCNSDGIFNDDKYDYDSVGLPFMKNLGRVVYEYEMKRKRKHIPDLSSMRFDYKE